MGNKISAPRCKIKGEVYFQVKSYFPLLNVAKACSLTRFLFRVS